MITNQIPSSCLQSRSFPAGRGGIVCSSVALQHSHQRPPRCQLLNPDRSGKPLCSSPEAGRVDAGGSSPAPCGESAEPHRDGCSHDIRQWNRGRDPNFSSTLERQVAAGGASPQPERSRFEAFLPTTRRLVVLFASELTPDGTVPTRPIRPFMEVHQKVRNV